MIYTVKKCFGHDDGLSKFVILFDFRDPPPLRHHFFSSYFFAHFSPPPPPPSDDVIFGQRFTVIPRI